MNLTLIFFRASKKETGRAGIMPMSKSQGTEHCIAYFNHQIF